MMACFRQCVWFAIFHLAVVLNFVVSDHVIIISKHGKDSDDCLSGNSTQPCLTLDFVFGNRGSRRLANNTKIVIKPGRFSLTKNTKFENIHNITIEGDAEKSVIVCRGGWKSVGIQFLRSSQLSFKGVVITKCRTQHISTTPSHPKIFSGIFFAYCNDLSFLDVSIRNNSGIGITLFDVGKTVNFTRVIMSYNMDRKVGFLPVVRNRLVPPIDQALFSNGSRPSPEEKEIYMESGGGIYVEFTKCGALDPFSCSSIAEQKLYNTNSKYIFRKCDFSFNIAEHKVGLKNDVKLDEQSAFGRGGGMTFLFKGAAENNSVEVDNCTFASNVASWGAGYYFALLDSSQNNVIDIKRSWIAENYAAMAGGGGRIVSLFPNQTQKLKANDLYHSDCVFFANRAIWGGGFSLSGTTRINPYVGSQKSRATFLVNSSFYENLATVGSAIGLNTKNLNDNTIGPGLSFVLLMKDCEFGKNKVIRTEDNRVIGEGAMYSEEVTLVFEGKNTFFDNNSTALVLDSSSVSVDGVLLFKDNHGIEGGAIALYGTSWIMLHKGCDLRFIRNEATSKGGAIYVKSPGPERLAFDTTELETGDCFFKYADDLRSKFEPDNWDVTVKFINNTAATAGGNAVYSSTLQHCRIMHEERGKSRALYWKPFHYESGGNGQPEVVTNPIVLHFDASEWRQPPGLHFNPKMVSLDEKNNSVYGTIKIIVKGYENKVSHKRQGSDMDEDYDFDDVQLYPPSALFLAKDRVQGVRLLGKEGAHFTYQFVTTAGQIIQTGTHNSTLKHCPEGYTQEEGENICKCMSKTKEQRGVVRCSGLSIFLQPGYWGSTDSNGDFYAVTCPDHYCTCCVQWSNTTAHKCEREPDVMFECQYSPQNQCQKGRYGLLCSECTPGLSVLLGSETCHKCSNIWLLLLIPMGIAGLFVVLIIMYFDINAFSGYLNAFLYSYQIVTLLTADSVQYDSFIGIVIGSTGLSGTGNSQLGVCLYNGFDNLQKLGFNYALPVYLLLCTVFVGVCLPENLWVKLYSRWKVHGDDGRSTSFGHAISFISVLCYSAFTSATLNIMHWINVDGDPVVFQAAYARFLGSEHLPYFLAALIVLIFIVLGFPIVLIFTPYFTARSRLCLKLEPSFTALKNCFKDGQKGSADMRHFAAFYFISRFVILCIGVFMQEETGRLVLVTLASILVLSIFAWFQPYKKWTMNFFDILLLTNLSAIGVLSVLLTIPNYLPKSIRTAVVIIIQILVYLPLVTVVFRSIFVLYEKRQGKKKRTPTDISVTDGVPLSEPSTTFRSLSVPLILGRRGASSKKSKNTIPHRVLENVVQNGH